jgi:hypothetical protein
MSGKVVDFDIDETPDWDFDLLILMGMPVKGLIPDSPEAVPKPWPALRRAGSQQKHRRGCCGETQRRNAPREAIRHIRASRLCCNKSASRHVMQSSGQALYDPALAMLLAAVLLPIALLGPPRAVPLPQPAATPIRLPSQRGIELTPRERRDKMPMFSAAADGQVFPSDDLQVDLAPSVQEMLKERALPARLILCVRAASTAQAQAPAATAFDAPLQPIGSFALQPSDVTATLDCSRDGMWWPCPPEALHGVFDVQAVIVGGADECTLDAVGNWIGAPVRVSLDSEFEDRIRLSIDRRIMAGAREPIRGVEWIERRSALRSSALGRDVIHRAAVVFPVEYSNVYAQRRVWPTVYVIPPQGEFVTQVEHISQMLRVASGSEAWPNAVHVVLDPSGVYGHHAFVDSMANGPCASALVQELIPALEQRFRLIPEPSARLLLGHGAGGWAALWLATEYPRVFGAAFASCPDAVDFSTIVGVDIYREESLFLSPSGEARAALRVPFGPKHDLVPLRISEEVQAAAVVSPLGRSGNGWDEWAARFSPTGAGSGMPRRLCDPSTGAIDPVAVESWSAFDLTQRAKRERDGSARTLASAARIMVGGRDRRMRECGVANLQGVLVRHMQTAVIEGEDFPIGPGWIEIVQGADETDIRVLAQLRFGWEMRDHLVQCGHQE